MGADRGVARHHAVVQRADDGRDLRRLALLELAEKTHVRAARHEALPVVRGPGDALQVPDDRVRQLDDSRRLRPVVDDGDDEREVRVHLRLRRVGCLRDRDVGRELGRVVRRRRGREHERRGREHDRRAAGVRDGSQSSHVGSGAVQHHGHGAGKAKLARREPDAPSSTEATDTFRRIKWRRATLGAVGRMLVTAVALVLALVAAGAESGGAALAGKKPKPKPRTVPVVAPWVRQQGTGFVDQKGAPVLLRGVNARSLDPVEYQQAVALHANFVRLPVYWSRIEPNAPTGTRHFYSPSELAQIDAEVKYLRAHHVNVLIDFHQYYWSPYFAARPGIAPLGLPAWLYQNGKYPPTAPGRFQAIADFYSDPALDKAYAGFVTMMVKRYSQSPNVVGYEI